MKTTIETIHYRDCMPLAAVLTVKQVNKPTTINHMEHTGNLPSNLSNVALTIRTKEYNNDGALIHHVFSRVDNEGRALAVNLLHDKQRRENIKVAEKEARENGKKT